MASDPHQSAARRYVDFVCREADWDYTTLARKSGVAASTITRFMNNAAVTHSLSARTLAKISHASGIRLPGSLGGVAEAFGAHASDAVRRAENGVPPPGTRDLPLLGQALGGAEDLLFENGAVQDYVERPWFLMGNGGAYAVYVHGTSMEPAYRHGELCYVDPNRPPRPGQDVVIQLRDGTGFIKTLERRTGHSVVLRQYNPEKRLDFAAADVESIHLVVAALKVRG